MAIKTVENQRKLRQLREGVEQSQARIRRLKVFVKNRNSKFWNDLKDEIKLSADSKVFFSDEILARALPDDPIKEWGQLKANKAAEHAFKGIMDVVEQAELRIERESNRVNDLSEKITEIEKSDRKAESGGRNKTRHEV